MTKKILVYFLITIASICLFQKVYAYSNFETTYTFDIPETTTLDNSYDSNYTYKQLFDYLLSLDDSNSDYTILTIDFVLNESNTSVSSIYVYTALKSNLTDYTTFIPTEVYLQGQTLYFGNGFSSGNYDIKQYDITNDYTYLVNCIVSNSGCNTYPTGKSNMGVIKTSGLPSDSSKNNNSYTLTLESTSQFIYDSKLPLKFIANNINNSSRYYKNLIINGNIYVVNDLLPTYKSIYSSSPTPDPDDPTPDPEPVPDDDLDIKDTIYWFTDNSDELGVLTNIYILLFLYCITILIFKVYDKIKAHLTKYRRF